MKKQGRADFFSAREQTLLMKLFEEEKQVLSTRSNTSSVARQRKEAWKRIADRINVVSDSGSKRSWQQVKNKYKNVVQSAKRRRINTKDHHGMSEMLSTNSEEDECKPQMSDNSLSMDVLPEAVCMDRMDLSGSESSFIGTSGHPVILLPVIKTEPQSLSEAETDVSDAQFEGVFSPKKNSAFVPPNGIGKEESADDIRKLYCCYLKKEMENRDHEMAYRALKMRKLEKELLLLDKQLL